MDPNTLRNASCSLPGIHPYWAAATPLIVIKPENEGDHGSSNQNLKRIIKSEIREVQGTFEGNDTSKEFSEENVANRVNDVDRQKVEVTIGDANTLPGEEEYIVNQTAGQRVKIKSEDGKGHSLQFTTVGDVKDNFSDSVKNEDTYNEFPVNMEQERIDFLKTIKREREDILETQDEYYLNHSDSDDSLSTPNEGLNEIKYVKKPQVVVHSGPSEKPHQCNECHKSFNHKSSLKRHQLSHKSYDSSEENPFKCKQCDKCFKNPGNLKGHMMVHTGEKPYECKFCGRCFRQSSTLRTHLFTHTGEKPYKCKECGKCFIHNGLLKEHESLHSGKKPFECDICGKCFAHTYILRRHARKHMADGTPVNNDNQT